MDWCHEVEPKYDQKNIEKPYHLMTGVSLHALPLSHSGWLEIRLFYVRIAPCIVESAPDCLTLFHPRREIGTPLEINGSSVPASDAVSLTLRRERLDNASSEVTYICTEAVRVSGAVDFEVYESGVMVLCGNLDRMEGSWSNGAVNDPKTGWGMDCYIAMGSASTVGLGSSSSVFFHPKLGVSSPSVEVYIAACCGSIPVILTKTIHVSPRRKVARPVTLDAIPEDEEVGKELAFGLGNGLIRRRKFKTTDREADGTESDVKPLLGQVHYTEDMYLGEDGQLSWFNAGVRVGVGIGLGMCLGIGIGVSLLMRSYQATTRNFRRFL